LLLIFILKESLKNKSAWDMAGHQLLGGRRITNEIQKNMVIVKSVCNVINMKEIVLCNGHMLLVN